jgi:surface protein
MATYGDIHFWDVSAITDMSAIFCASAYGANLGCNPACVSFNADVSSWETSQVTSMLYAFRGTSAFNQPLTYWNTSSLVNMGAMFMRADAFNQPLPWDVSHVTDMQVRHPPSPFALKGARQLPPSHRPPRTRAAPPPAHRLRIAGHLLLRLVVQSAPRLGRLTRRFHAVHVPRRAVL